jgi:DUF2933 family protein
MSVQDHLGNEGRVPRTLSRNARMGLVFAGFAAVAVILLFTEHRAHVFGLLVWLPLLACPLMHVFMHHGGHSHHHAAGRSSEGRKD